VAAKEATMKQKAVAAGEFKNSCLRITETVHTTGANQRLAALGHRTGIFGGKEECDAPT
jgi:hypothetical protein